MDKIRDYTDIVVGCGEELYKELLESPVSVVENKNNLN